jgi:hypothetical protein
MTEDLTRLLIAIHTAYEEGRMASEFDKKSNTMITPKYIHALMSELEEYIPEKMEPIQAAKAMKLLQEEERTKAIKESTQKVIDMRNHFRHKMSKNGGAYGLVQQLVQTINEDDPEKFAEVLRLMQDLEEESNK